MATEHLEYIIYIALVILVCISLLARFSSIPTKLSGIFIRSANIVQINGKDGALSPEQIKAILTKLDNQEGTNFLNKHLAVEAAIVDGPLVTGNAVKLLIDGPITYDEMFLAINNAKNHINMETFIIENDEVGQRFIKLLVKKQQSGVQVNLIYDSVGSFNTPNDFFKQLKDNGGNILEFNPVNPLKTRKDWALNLRDHRKLLIADGEVAFTGGINISSVYSSGFSGKKRSTNNEIKWRDTHLRLAGPVVSEFQKMFITTWNEQKGEPLVDANYFPEIKQLGKEVVRAIGSSPKQPYCQMYVTLLSAINSAESQVLITNAYFVPDQQLLTALKNAAQRNVEVKLLLPSKSDSNLVFYASRSFYDELLRANIKIYERQDALLHAKTTLIDSVWSTIGSTNLDWRSFINNQEINAVVLGQNFGSQMQLMFENDLNFSKLITLKEWRNRSLIVRLKERAARLWERFL